MTASLINGRETVYRLLDGGRVLGSPRRRPLALVIGKLSDLSTSVSCQMERLRPVGSPVFLSLNPKSFQ